MRACVASRGRLKLASAAEGHGMGIGVGVVTSCRSCVFSTAS